MLKIQLLSQVTAIGAGATVQAPANEMPPFLRSYQAGMVGGTGATVHLDLSSDGKTWVEAASFFLAPDTAEGVSSETPWRFMRGRVEAISGGGAIDMLATFGNVT